MVTDNAACSKQNALAFVMALVILELWDRLNVLLYRRQPMSDQPSSSPVMSYQGLNYALYDDKACSACGADNWRGEKLALAYLEAEDTYMCPPCVNVFLAEKSKN